MRPTFTIDNKELTWHATERGYWVGTSDTFKVLLDKYEVLINIMKIG